jgi:F0F1-type ATP synthase membrane subunit b/b'
MGFLDKLKGMFRGKETQVKEGIDKASDAAQKAVPDQHDAKVDAAAEKAKDVVDDPADSAKSETPPTDTPPAATPPTATPPPATAP